MRPVGLKRQAFEGRSRHLKSGVVVHGRFAPPRQGSNYRCAGRKGTWSRVRGPLCFSRANPARLSPHVRCRPQSGQYWA
jgi:hypothetical protein